MKPGVEQSAAPRGRRLRAWTRPVRHGLAYVALRGLAGISSRLPLPVAAGLGAVLGRVVGWLSRRTRAAVGRGLGVLGAADRTDAHFADLGRRFAEFVAAGAALQRVDVPEALRLRLSAGPTVVLTAHYGHWELLGAALAAAGVEVHSVAARAGRGPLHRWLARHRVTLGVTVHPPGGGARTALDRLAGGHPVALFFDLDTREKARTLTFLDRPTRFSRTAERLIALSGARALWLWSVREPDGRYRLAWGELTGPDPLTEAASALEAAVRADPVQWVWLVDRWPPPAG